MRKQMKYDIFESFRVNGDQINEFIVPGGVHPSTRLPGIAACYQDPFSGDDPAH